MEKLLRMTILHHSQTKKKINWKLGTHRGKRHAGVHFDLKSAGLKYFSLEGNVKHKESGTRDTVAELAGKGNIKTESRATQGLHVSSYFLVFPNCFLLALPGSQLCLCPEKAQSLPLPPPKNSLDLWNNPQSAIGDSPKKQALQCQGLNTPRLGKA